MDHSNRNDRRSFRSEFQPMIQRLLDNAPSYDARARMDDGLCINETTKVAPSQSITSSLLHTKWQEEGSVDRLTREECDALARAGYRIQRDEDGLWVWWREKRISHLWLHVNESGWATSSAPNGAKWKLIGSFSQPAVPYFHGYQIDIQDLLREGLTTAIIALREYVPSNVFNDQFFGICRELCDEAIQSMEIELDWVNHVILNGMLTRHQ